MVKQEDKCRETLLEEPCGETGGDVINIMKGVKGDDINRSTWGTATGVAVGFQGRYVVGGTSDVAGGCGDASCLGGGCDTK